MAAKKEEKQEEQAPESGGMNMKMIIIMVVVLLVAVGASVGLTLMLVGGDGGNTAAEEVPEPPKDPHYIALKSMNINLPASASAQFLQLEMNLLTYLPQVTEIVETNMPVIRDEVLTSLSTMDFSDIKTPEGKEAMRKMLLQVINDVLQQYGGEIELESGKMVTPTIEAVYFTRLVMQ